MLTDILCVLFAHLTLLYKTAGSNRLQNALKISVTYISKHLQINNHLPNKIIKMHSQTPFSVSRYPWSMQWLLESL